MEGRGSVIDRHGNVPGYEKMRLSEKNIIAGGAIAGLRQTLRAVKLFLNNSH
jgi:hypothetical protein